MDELELALDDCLQRLASAKSSLAQCLARYPQYEAELRPLLEAAMRLHQGRTVRPSGAMRDRTRAKLLSHIEAHPKQPRKTRVIPRLVVGMMVVALAFIFAGAGLAQSALPGEALYPLKLSSEYAWRATSPDPVAVDLMLADRRSSELLTLASRQVAANANVGIVQPNAETEGIAAYTDVLDRLETETGGSTAEQILLRLQAHQDKLARAGIHVPKLDDIVSHGRAQTGEGQGNKP
jgi:hypothetical protein